METWVSFALHRNKDPFAGNLSSLRMTTKTMWKANKKASRVLSLLCALGG